MDALDAGDRRVAVGHVLAGDPDEHAVGGDDREVARHVAHHVVLGGEARRGEHAGVGAGGVDARVRAGDGRGAGHVGRGVAGQEAAETDAVEVDRIGGGDALRITVHGDLEGGRRDVRGDARRLRDGVVGGVGAAEGIAGDGDGLGRADVAVREDPGGVGAVERDGVPAERRDRSARDRRGNGAVVDLVRGGDAGHGQGARGDVPREPGRLHDGVIAGLGAGQGIARGRDRLRRADVPIREDAGGAGGDQRDRVAGERADGASGERSRERAVVGLAGHRDARDGQGSGRDVRGEPGGLADGIIAGVGAPEDRAGDGDGLGVADVPVREGAGHGGGVNRHGVTAERSDRAARDDGGEGAVVDLVGRGDAGERQGERRDVPGERAEAADTVTIDRLAAGGDAGAGRDRRRGREGDELAVAGVPRRIGRGAHGEDRGVVPADEAGRGGQHRAGDVGGIGPVVDLGRRRSEGRRQRRREAVEQALARAEHGADAIARVILTEIEGQSAGHVAGSGMVRIGVGAPDTPGLARAAGGKRGAAGVVDQAADGQGDVAVRRRKHASGREGQGAGRADEDVAGGGGGEVAVQRDVAAEDGDRAGDGQVGADGEG